MKEMRRIERKMDDHEAMELLVGGEYGILSTVSAENEPYGVPVSYVVYGDSIYFHCATVGSKLDNILNNNRVCFTVVGQTRVLPEKFSTEYESVVVYGNAAIVNKEEDKIKALMELIRKYSPNFINEGEEYINKAHNRTALVQIKISSYSGKHRV